MFQVEAPGLKTASLDMGSGGCSLQTHNKVHKYKEQYTTQILLHYSQWKLYDHINVDMGSGDSNLPAWNNNIGTM